MFDRIFSVLGIIFFLIFTIGHFYSIIKIDTNIFEKAKEAEVALYEKIKLLEEEDNFKILFWKSFLLNFHYIMQGIVWRIKREWYYVKKTANFDFKD